jgi:hypothetical protein
MDDDKPTGYLEIYYRKPFTREVHLVPLTPGSFYEVVPTPGYVIDHIRVSMPAAGAIEEEIEHRLREQDGQ